VGGRNPGPCFMPGSAPTKTLGICFRLSWRRYGKLTPMAFVFYDIETSGISQHFDQILQFAAILTDDDLQEVERFEIRSRLQPHVVPSPMALHVTGMSIEDILDPGRPSNYEMITAIRRTIGAWGPATFLGYNSLRFDEEFLRHAFYQNLHPPYLTNTGGSRRTDALNIVRAALRLCVLASSWCRRPMVGRPRSSWIVWPPPMASPISTPTMRSPMLKPRSTSAGSFAMALPISGMPSALFEQGRRPGVRPVGGGVCLLRVLRQSPRREPRHSNRRERSAAQCHLLPRPDM
jgi:hypothetical protein